MANGSILTLIDDILARGDTKGFEKDAIRVLLTVNREMYDKLNNLDCRMDEHDKRLDRVERSSILMWVSGHQKMSVAIFLGYLFVTAAVDVRQVAAAILQYVKP